MAITQALNNALSGLTAAKRGAEVSSSNIANALTPGYGKRSLVLQARDHGGLGAGVNIVGMNRQSDPFILSTRREADATVGFKQTLAMYHTRLEDVFGKPGAALGLTARVADLDDSLIGASSDPSSTIRLNGASDAFKALAKQVRVSAQSISQMRVDAEADIAQQVEHLNRSIIAVDRLNDDIVRFGRAGHPVAGLYDQRQQVIDSISEIVPIRQIERTGGRVALITESGETLVDHRPREISFTRLTVIEPAMSFPGGQLEGIKIDGRPVPGNTAFGLLGGGSLEAAFKVRDEVTVSVQQKLDDFADYLVTKFASTSVDSTIPTTLPPAVPSGILEADRIMTGDIIGMSNTLRISARIDPDQGGDPTRLRDGLFSTAPAPATGNATLLNGWSNLLHKPTTSSLAGPMRNTSGRAADLSSELSGIRVRSERDLSYARATRESLKSKELAEGVDTDQEMQNLMILEQAYAANAKVIQTVDSMLNKILEI